MPIFGILGVFAMPVMGDLPSGNNIPVIVGQVLLPDAAKQGNSASLTIEVPSATASSTFPAFVTWLSERSLTQSLGCYLA
jgi:hypothetical protein